MINRDLHEVDEPKGGDERAFKAKHKVKVTDHPEGTKLPPITTSKKKRLADPVDTETTYEEVEHLDETIDKVQVERKLRSKYMGGNPKVTFHRGVVKVNAAGKDYHHKITKGQVEDRPFMTVDEEYVSEAKGKKPSPSTDNPDMVKIRKIAGPGRIMHKEPWHPDHVGHNLYTHTDHNSNIPKIRAFKVHQKTGKVTEFKNYKPSFGEEVESVYSIFWRDANGMDKQKHGLSEDEVTRLASALEGAGSCNIFIDEEKMTDDQMKTREKYVKGMKSKDDDLRKRYGKRWKDVMYAIATKNAMKEEAESLDEIAKSEEEPLHTQLRKRTNANEVSLTFKNGKTHIVSRGHANKALTMLSGMKPADRQNAHAEMSKSHEHFMDALDGKIAKPGKAGVSLAGPKMKKEEVESLDEVIHKSYDDFVKSRVDMDADSKTLKDMIKINNKRRGPGSKSINKELKRRLGLKKEDVESLDELKKSTLASYVGKAAPEVLGHAYAAGMTNTNDPKTKEKSFRKAFKRVKGIERATKRLAKEDVESLDEVGDTKRGQKLLGKVRKRATGRLIKATDPMWKSGMSDDDRKTARKYQDVGRMADDRMKEDVESLDEGPGGNSTQSPISHPPTRPVPKPPVKKVATTAPTTVKEAGDIIPPKSPKMKSLSGGPNNFKLDKPRAKSYNVPTQKDRSLEDDD